jgi:5-methylcytosine-specific restriction endonuclease McrA
MARKPKKTVAPKQLTERQIWQKQFVTKLRGYHKKNLEKVAAKLLKRIDGVKNSMVSRSKKYKVECRVTVNELRQLAFDAYGTSCKYSKRVLKIDNMVFDHLVPISKGGTSNIDNIQIISRFSNNMKGSLDEPSFLLLLAWLETVPEDLRKDISIRLAHGIH